MKKEKGEGGGGERKKVFATILSNSSKENRVEFIFNLWLSVFLQQSIHELPTSLFLRLGKTQPCNSTIDIILLENSTSLRNHN
jgi:hypothetical protein